MNSIVTRSLTAACLALAAFAVPVSAEAPAWVSKTIITKGDAVYAVGHSQPDADEQAAKDEALADAVRQFIRYCRVSVDSFDRSIELYTKSKGKESALSDQRSQSTVRAKAFVTCTIPEEWYIDRRKEGCAASVLLKVPKEEMERIVKENNIKLSLDILFYAEDEKGKMQVINDGSVLRSGDGYALYVRPSDPCYLYVYQVDGLGRSYRLFPNPDYKTAENPLPAAADLWIPGTGTLFTLDAVTGKEHFFVFASPDPLAEFEGPAAARLEKKDIENVIGFKKMGVAGLRPKRDAAAVVPPKHDTLDVVEVKKKLQADGAFVYETFYWHK